MVGSFPERRWQPGPDQVCRHHGDFACSFGRDSLSETVLVRYRAEAIHRDSDAAASMGIKRNH
jgi:hypothetical protein